MLGIYELLLFRQGFLHIEQGYLNIEDKQKRDVALYGRYLLESSLMEHSFRQFPPSQVAAGALFMSGKLFKCAPFWPCELAELTGFSQEELRPVTSAFLRHFRSVPGSEQQSIQKKFLLPKYECIAKIQLIKNKVPASQE